MLQNKKWLLSGGLIGLALILLGLVAYLRRPSADVSQTAEASGASVIWGKITDANGKPLVGITVSVGSEGTTSEQQGSYLLVTSEYGRLLADFRNNSTREFYTPIESEQVVSVIPGQSIHHDFELKKIDNPPTPIIVTAPTPTPISAVVPSTQSTTTATPAPKPAQPTNLTTVAKTKPSRVELKWKDNANSESGFIIQRTDAKTFQVKLIDIPANTTSYNDTAVEKGKTYFYRVRAYSGSGTTKSYSALSNERKVKAK